MDYYASLPIWRIPKWLGATLGGIFSLIVIVCVALIVHLTRPVQQPTPPAAVATPTSVAHSASAAHSPPNAAAAPAKAESPIVAPQSAPAATRTRDVPRTHRRAILAKHDSKPRHQAKTDIDRILGL